MSDRRYNHAFTICFSVVTDRSCCDEEVCNYPRPSEVRQAILQRVAGIDDNELMEAIGAPFDSYDEDT